MTKNFLQDGKWIENPNAVQIVLCKCGGKYIKTRPNQTSCLPCAKVLAQSNK
jgi:hypothetical protein